MQAIIPYITFKGHTKDALEFYTKAFDGQVLHSQTFGEAKMAVAKEYENQIMHAHFRAGNLDLMFSDAADKAQASVLGNAISLSMNFGDVATQDKVFNALSEGATITMPLQETFWGARFGMLQDKFGIHWMFNHDYPQAK